MFQEGSIPKGELEGKRYLIVAGYKKEACEVLKLQKGDLLLQSRSKESRYTAQTKGDNTKLLFQEQGKDRHPIIMSERRGGGNHSVWRRSKRTFWPMSGKNRLNTKEGMQTYEEGTRQRQKKEIPICGKMKRGEQGHGVLKNPWTHFHRRKKEGKPSCQFQKGHMDSTLRKTQLKTCANTDKKIQGREG